MTRWLSRTLSALFIESFAVFAFFWFISSSQPENTIAHDDSNDAPSALAQSESTKADGQRWFGNSATGLEPLAFDSGHSEYVESTLERSASTFGDVAGYYIESALDDLFGKSDPRRASGGE